MVSEAGRAYAVCVYCSASTIDPAQLELAARVGTEIARRGWQLVSGGGHVSMMGAVATAARAGGANTIGVIPKHLVHREVADVDADELVVTDTMRQRKQVMEDRADAFLTLPGGIGTLEEFFETWTGAYLGVHDKPVVVLDPDGHYRGLFAWVDELHARGFVPQPALDRVRVVADLDEAFEALRPRAPRRENGGPEPVRNPAAAQQQPIEEH
ncbi:LOG family protein [Nocardia cyriacigeorgica]|uniref:Cytokinin riboside 5'-monophosphate phosphoribohydrolase n=1 Tax=Nocardia cyriacigeorgica TaxID=135487 RepID=A0A4U8WCC5_9NOCA|nr:TIGR00730 family Rossman fold protein [Nocardia cyriacigeorgica]VFA99448.1 LOG family protein yvdD [Nocardia cyriacigeorgica]